MMTQSSDSRISPPSGSSARSDVKTAASWRHACTAASMRRRRAQTSNFGISRGGHMRVAGFRHVALNFDFLRSPKRRGEHRGADWGRARAQWPRKAALLLDSGRVVLLI